MQFLEFYCFWNQFVRGRVGGFGNFSIMAHFRLLLSDASSKVSKKKFPITFPSPQPTPNKKVLFNFPNLSLWLCTLQNSNNHKMKLFQVSNYLFPKISFQNSHKVRRHSPVEAKKNIFEFLSGKGIKKNMNFLLQIVYCFVKLLF